MKHQNIFLSLSVASVALILALSARGGELIFADDGRVGYRDNPKQWWSEYRVHDIERPVPPKVQVDPESLHFAPAPPDAKILFDGSNLDAWRPTKWIINDEKLLECVDGGIITKESFSDFQLHLEFRSPADFEGPWGNRGNNGVIIFGCVEIQIFDNYTNNTYPDGLCGAVYGQTPPLVNACLPPGNWQTYDIFFSAPRYDENDKEIEPARVTIVFNGVLVQNSTIIYGGTGHGTLPRPFGTRKTGTIAFSGHGCPVQFRNVWVRSTPREP